MSVEPSQNSTSSGAVRTEIDDSVGWLIIDNPLKRNALTLAMWEAVPDAVARLEATAAVRVIILRGAGAKSFVAGADISEFEQTRATSDKAKVYEDINVAAFRALKNCEKPTIAMIRGHCLGGGLGLALACDLRVADPTAVFGIPAARLGIAYPVEAIADILQAVPPAAAKRLLFTAERVGSAEALRIGLIDEVSAEGALAERIENLAETMGGNAPLTLRAAKRAVSAFLSGGGAAEMDAARVAAERCFDSEDFKEGRDAFLQKRSPTFRGI
ncbi:enoyl-CoA hydratase [Roseibium aquae]|uniref:Enoyl-CoA hydratase n=1 Tax=Roseibium aquae TaxID=1323746 RepID=A0A916TMM3_9HYPH|nr:enoyl-CoA hydratase [Roseibium aquae]GGB59522.1 enoyl-CoA hydratase [Roseibium aquae]